MITRVVVGSQWCGPTCEWLVDYDLNGKSSRLSIVAHDAIEAKQIASAALGIAFGM
ncbi:hypothetical protein [Bradyrhizobium sp. CCGUVB23]|uniref:hypothetical protein n=1 Tax=Bradyrhizobium sp. CCGUVB23 TaxID=2949630 RepID=UPI0020B3DCA1|nr:hypothetical protein [Bradyrhizobium sp. CCGUVB23]MCP3468519.1 hypothetical protein [Bradyrhizobium sp. CCGUVB23]